MRGFKPPLGAGAMCPVSDLKSVMEAAPGGCWKINLRLPIGRAYFLKNRRVN